MTERILFVDDDPNILAAIERQLRKHFALETATKGEQGLEKIANHEPFAVIVTDFKMPVMDGIQFLSRVRELSPDSVRMMLTGYADVNTAIEAVNAGNIFRLLTKPCPPETLIQALAAGVKQYRLVTAERELLEQTLRGSIKVLTEVLALLNPEAFGRASRITRYAKEVAIELKATDIWQCETAAMLSQIGCITLPEETLKKLYRGHALTEEESQLFDMHPFIASDLLGKIPRMDKVAEIIAHQEKRFDGSGIPHGETRGKDIPLGARILKLVLDFDALEAAGRSKQDALTELKSRPGWYDPEILTALERVVRIETRYERRVLRLDQLEEAMILAKALKSSDGRLLIARGHTVTRPLLERLKNFARTSGIQEPIEAFVPVRQDHGRA